MIISVRVCVCVRARETDNVWRERERQSGVTIQHTRTFQKR